MYLPDLPKSCLEVLGSRPGPPDTSRHPKSCLEALRRCAGPPDTSRHPEKKTRQNGEWQDGAGPEPSEGRGTATKFGGRIFFVQPPRSRSVQDCGGRIASRSSPCRRQRARARGCRRRSEREELAARASSAPAREKGLASLTRKHDGEASTVWFPAPTQHARGCPWHP